MKKLFSLLAFAATLGSLLIFIQPVFAQGNAFTYQGRLQSNGIPLNGLYDFQFSLSNAPSGGSQVGSTITQTAISVTNGLFTVTNDFGAVFAGNDTWLAIGVRSNGSGAGFTALTPLQELTPTPYAIYAPNAGSAATATTASTANSVTAADITGTLVVGQLPAAVVTNNETGVTLGGAFTGNGGGLTNLTVSAAQLTSVGNTGSASNNFFVGPSGNVTMSGYDNTAIGDSALTNNTSGYGNTANGTDALSSNTTGFVNTANGAFALYSNTVGSFNTAIGGQALYANTTGTENTANGLSALYANTSGSYNTAIGASALQYNTTGAFNTAIGQVALIWNTTGSNNIALGYLAGSSFTGNESSNIDIGNVGSLGENNIIRIGSNQTTAYIAGVIHGNGGGLTNLTVNASQLTGTVPTTVLSNFQGPNYNTLGGGFNNAVSSQYATVGGGNGNTATGQYATVAGGNDNQANNTYSTVGGGVFNNANGNQATVGGGNTDVATGAQATVGGGYNNTANNQFATVGGGYLNTAGGYSATVAGGYNNTASGASFATVSGGEDNFAIALTSTVGGGVQNHANNTADTVGGGEMNITSGDHATVSGGLSNTASNQFTTVGGGHSNSATNTGATVPGGTYNTAGGTGSFAAGNNAQATNIGAFVWSDGQAGAFPSTAPYQFSVHAAGGVRFVTAGAGMTLDGAAVLTNGAVVQLPATVVTNGETNVTLIGTFTGNGGGLTNLNASQLTSIGGSGDNFFVGPNTGNSTTSGGDNTAIGYLALPLNTSGSANTADGTLALRNSTTGSLNTAIGYGGLQLNASGNNNTAIGYEALAGLGYLTGQGGTNNIALGYGAGSAFNANESSNIDIGNLGVKGENNTIRIGDTNVQTATYIAGVIYGNGGGLTNVTVSLAGGAALGAGSGNAINGATDAFIGGGEDNTIQSAGNYAVIGGGNDNTNSAEDATVAGGQNNNASGQGAFVGGGQFNTASGADATVPGGQQNLASGNAGFAAGSGAEAVNDNSFVWSDGSVPTVSVTTNSFVARASGGFFFYSDNGGGWLDFTLGGTLTPGDQLTIELKDAIVNPVTREIGNISATHLVVNGDSLDSIAAGLGAELSQAVLVTVTVSGSVITLAWPGSTPFSGWEADTTGQDGGDATESIANSGSDSLAGGYPSTPSGVELASGSGSWSMLSDRNIKANFQTVDAQAVLAEVAAIPMTTWNYKTQAKSIRHIGPMAQDFHAFFGVGENATTISTVDEGGVALAAIQGLNQKMEDREARIQEQGAEIEKLKAKADKVDSLEKQLNELKQMVQLLAERK
jgi:hypothetical protein